MVLSNVQVQTLIKSPQNKAPLQRAQRQEDRLRFHAQVVEGKEQAGVYYAVFLLWVKSFLTAREKYEQFEKLLLFPLPTNNLVDIIADEYSKVFNAQNSYFGYEFDNPELKAIFEDYLERNNDRDFWETKVFGAMLTGINSIVVVDLDVNQETQLPEPYYYLLDISSVIDVGVDREGNIQYLIFKESENVVAVFDELSYRLFTKGDNDTYYESYQAEHPLGYCPASFMWSDNLDTRNKIIKQSPLSSVLSYLDKCLAKEVSKDCLDVYASFPITWMYEPECSYESPKYGKCTGGFIHGDGGPVACPSCSKESIVGAGTLMKVPILQSSSSEGNFPDLREPAGVISVDRESLDYNTDEVCRMRSEIIEIATGKTGSKLTNREAINEDQVKSQFESQTNILRYIAQNFEKINTWVIDTVAKLMFEDQYLGCNINYGTEFYLQTLSEVTEDYKVGKAAGLPSFILLSKRNQIEELQSKNNPSEKERLNILKYLEPYPDMTPFECKNLGINEMDKIGFGIKVNFVTFIHKFELEYGNIVEWGSALTLTEKIKRIKQVLNDYVKEQQKTSSAESGGTEGNTGTAAA